MAPTLTASSSFLVAVVILSAFPGFSSGSVLFSTLPRTLVVSASPQPGQVLKAGEDKITVTWSLNGTAPAGTDASYKTVQLKLCYAPVSQVDRAWRKTKDDLAKDKTCTHLITSRPYAASNQSYEYLVQKDVPTATYFVRAYALDANKVQVGFGQTTDKAKDTNLFEVEAITGRHASLDIAASCFSAFSVLSLAGFFMAEKRRGKKGNPTTPAANM
ncbi:hypothetical protein MLD38_039410 [Melastoma candidum]|uniref:Uncharacterized protein n=1 Tax=Melastoma candidum TaxID=119954 RepID=A0ACB9L1Z3_9MYRT|nr:hypothetical protein MLD38_039410 [Melastoma candidum]